MTAITRFTTNYMSGGRALPPGSFANKNIIGRGGSCGCCTECCHFCAEGTPKQIGVKFDGKQQIILEHISNTVAADVPPYAGVDACRWRKLLSDGDLVIDGDSITRVELVLIGYEFAVYVYAASTTRIWYRQQATLMDCEREHVLPWLSGGSAQPALTIKPKQNDPDCFEPNGLTVSGLCSNFMNCTLSRFYRVWLEPVPTKVGTCAFCPGLGIDWFVDYDPSVSGAFHGKQYAVESGGGCTLNSGELIAGMMLTFDCDSYLIPNTATILETHNVEMFGSLFTYRVDVFGVTFRFPLATWSLPKIPYTTFEKKCNRSWEMPLTHDTITAGAANTCSLTGTILHAVPVR